MHTPAFAKGAFFSTTHTHPSTAWRRNHHKYPSDIDRLVFPPLPACLPASIIYGTLRACLPQVCLAPLLPCFRVAFGGSLGVGERAAVMMVASSAA